MSFESERESTPLQIERITRKVFDSLPEYSLSLPTGTTIGKVWKRRLKNRHDCDQWLLGEYVSCEVPGHVGINWRKIEIVG